MLVMEYLDSKNVTLLNMVNEAWELSDIKVCHIKRYVFPLDNSLGCAA